MSWATCGICCKHAKVARGADAGARYAHNLIPPGQDGHAQPINPLGNELQQARRGLEHQPCAPDDQPQGQPCCTSCLVAYQRISHNTYSPASDWYASLVEVVKPAKNGTCHMQGSALSHTLNASACAAHLVVTLRNSQFNSSRLSLGSRFCHKIWPAAWESTTPCQSRLPSMMAQQAANNMQTVCAWIHARSLTNDALVHADTQGLQGVDEALLEGHGLVAEAADVVLVQRQHGEALADAPTQLHTQPAACAQPNK